MHCDKLDNRYRFALAEVVHKKDIFTPGNRRKSVNLYTLFKFFFKASRLALKIPHFICWTFFRSLALSLTLIRLPFLKVLFKI
jgi:hypothetical protein